MKRYFFLFFAFSSITGIVRENDVTFQLFTKEDSQTSKQINNGNVWVDNNSSVFFLIHGWQENKYVPWYGELTNVLLARTTKTCVIQVDWSRPASQFYLFAAAECSTVGRIIAEFILNYNISFRNIHLCGFSLGAHIAGFVGKNLQSVGRITALDPAGPLFEEFFIPDTSRLVKNDAKVVVVIHTDPFKAGFFRSCGTIDIYANGVVVNQPGCLARLLSCSHYRSVEIYIDALERPETLIATSCADHEAGECYSERRIDLGSELEEEDAGTYYLETRSKKPFGISGNNA